MELNASIELSNKTRRFTCQEKDILMDYNVAGKDAYTATQVAYLIGNREREFKLVENDLRLIKVINNCQNHFTYGN